MTTENTSGVFLHHFIGRQGSSAEGRRRLADRLLGFAQRDYSAAMNLFDRLLATLPGISAAVETGMAVNGASPQYNHWYQFSNSENGAIILETINAVIDHLQQNGIYYPTVTYWGHSRLALNLSLNNEWGSRTHRSVVRHSSGEDGDRCRALFNQWMPLQCCDHCQNDFYEWELRGAYGDDLVCENCIDNHYTYLELYGTYVCVDSTRDAIDENGDSVVIASDDDDYIYDPDADEWRHVNYPRTRLRNVIGEYHSSKPHFRVLADDWTIQYQRAMGIELEVEANNIIPNDAAARIHQTVNGSRYGHRVFFERDGSLRNGFEIISQPMSLPAIRETFAFLKDQSLVANLRSHLTSTCGLHIHVGRMNLSQLAIAKMVVFVNDPANDAFITALARRYNTDYCRMTEKNLATAHLPGNRYEAINLTGRNTIEFRIFKGSLKYEAVIAAAEFVHALVEFCSQPNTRIKSLHVKAFMRFCRARMRGDTAILRQYLKDRNIGRFGVGEAA